MAEPITELYKRLSKDEQARDTEWRNDIQIDLDEMERELSAAAEIKGKWARMAIRAEAISSDMEGEMTSKWHIARSRARTVLGEDSGKVTESRVDDEAHQDPFYQVAAHQYRQAKILAADLREIADSMQQRLYLLQTINKRQTADRNSGTD